MSAKKIFISYAHEDEAFKDELVSHLSGLQRSGHIDAWTDRAITAGQEWDQSIKTALLQAEIVLFLISADFMASDYIQDVEIKSAIDRYEQQNSVVVVPVIIRACDFSSLPLSRFQALPLNATPVKSWTDRDEAWFNVVEGLKKVLDGNFVPSPPPTPSIAPSGIALHDYHRFTCDRVPHNDKFQELYSDNRNDKTHFYYLYGVDLQSHLGFFNRLAYDLEGRLLDYLNPDLDSRIQSLKIELTFDFSENMTIYKTNILKSFFAAMHTTVNEHEPLLEKTLTYICENSPLVQGLGSNDFVCIFLGISQWDWDEQITPEATRWFINQFCRTELPENSPQFLFFFAIMYEEEDEELQEEVKAVLRTAKHVVVLPELNMVEFRDIARWLEKYKKIAPSARDRNKMLKELKKGLNGQSKLYMEDVEDTLLKWIDQFNSSLTE